MRTRHLPVLSLVLFCAAAAAQPFPMQEQAGVRWVCAGIGLDEREAFAKLEPDASLKLVFAAGKQGAYLARVDVVLTDREGKRAALKFTAEAPICLIQTPAGRYSVEAAFGNEKRTIATTVAKQAGKPGMLVFRFPERD
jgi:hypothetical protein